MDAVPLEPSLTRSSYVDPDEFVREREAVLYPGWFCVGRAESVPGPGDYLTADVVGESIIVVRHRAMARWRRSITCAAIAAGRAGALGSPPIFFPGRTGSQRLDPLSVPRPGPRHWTAR